MLAEVQFEGVGGSPVAPIRGEIDMSNVGELGLTLQNAVGQASAGLVVDFAQTEYLDSAGLQFIFDLAKRLRDRGQRLFLVVPEGSPVGTVLDIVNVETLAPRDPTLAQPVAPRRPHAADLPPQK